MKKTKPENEKNAVVKMLLIAESGYCCEENARISPNQWEEILKVINETQIDYKSKYEKCIKTIKKFDAGIIGLYDL